MQNPSQDPFASPRAHNQDLKDMDDLFVLEIKIERQNLDKGYTNDHWPHLNQDQDASQKPPISSKAPNEDLKDMDVLCTFKIKIDIGVSKASDHIQIIIKMLNLSQEPQAPT